MAGRHRLRRAVAKLTAGDGYGVWQMGIAQPYEREDQATVRREIPRYHVVLWDDDDHSYKYVIEMMSELFGHPKEHGLEIAQSVDLKGSAVCLTTTLEHAELKRDQIHAYGRDREIRTCAGSMRSTIWPAD